MSNGKHNGPEGVWPEPQDPADSIQLQDVSTNTISDVLGWAGPGLVI